MNNENTLNNQEKIRARSEFSDIPALTDSNTDEPESSPNNNGQNIKMVITLVIATLLIVAFIVVSIIFLLQPATPTQKIRDIFIIFMALESLLIGLTLIILIIQLARLINLMQNEIKPILDSTNESVNTLRGTVTFLSNNFVEPVMKLNEYLAALKQLTGFVRFTKKDQ